MTSFTSLAKIEQWDKENLAGTPIESLSKLPLYTKQRLFERDKENLASN